LEVAAAPLNVQPRELVAAELIEEKVNIAGELHDVIARAVSVIVIQASAAEGMLDIDPAGSEVLSRPPKTPDGRLRGSSGDSDRSWVPVTTDPPP
jgi:hypothetical protein